MPRSPGRSIANGHVLTESSWQTFHSPTLTIHGSLECSVSAAGYLIGKSLCTCRSVFPSETSLTKRAAAANKRFATSGAEGSMPGSISSSIFSYWIFHTIVYHLFQWIVYQCFSPKFTSEFASEVFISEQSLPPADRLEVTLRRKVYHFI